MAGVRTELIARGAHLQALRCRGLVYDTVEGTRVLDIPASADAAEAHFDSETVVLLCVKSHQTPSALADLQAHAPVDTVMVCVQNGVANEREVLRLFPSTYATCVIVPGTHLEPGTVVLDSTDAPGILDIGRFPGGTDAVTAAVSEDLRAASFVSEERADIMAWKYRKLVSNLANAVDALCAPGPAASELIGLAQAEGEAVIRQADIAMVSSDDDRARRDGLITMRPGARAGGGSSRQSLLRGASVTEVDYLTGEIVLIGRVRDIPTPVNELIQRRASAAARANVGPGSVDAAILLADLAAQ
jgi:2-dehydropantoate 2-reductase